MSSMFPDGKAGLSMKVIAGIMIALLYSMGMINVTTQTESEGESHIKARVKSVEAKVEKTQEGMHKIDKRLAIIESQMNYLINHLKDPNSTRQP